MSAGGSSILDWTGLDWTGLDWTGLDSTLRQGTDGLEHGLRCEGALNMPLPFSAPSPILWTFRSEIQVYALPAVT
jgi:hypothetical protein